MQILYLLKEEPDETVTKFMLIHKKTHNVEVIDLREDNNYIQIMEHIEKSEKVISW